jgi:hypothetical protein
MKEIVDYQKSSYISSLWAIQDSLLQSYRSVFITAESIFISVSIATQSDIFKNTIQDNKFPYTILPALVVLIGLYVNTSWLEITSKRGIYVHFLQTLLRRHENPTVYPDREMNVIEPFERLRKFQDHKKYREKQMKCHDFIGAKATRTALGSVLPCIFFIYWIYSSIYFISKCFPVVHYFGSIHFYFWVSIAILSLYLFVSLIIKICSKEKNPVYKFKFFEWLLWLIIGFPFVGALVHANIFGYFQ